MRIAIESKEHDIMDIDSALAKLASAPAEDFDLSHVETRIMRALAQSAAVVRSQRPIRLGAMIAALAAGLGFGAFASASNQSGQTLVSGAHLAPSALLAMPL
jgi:hypothetical protein